MEFLNPAALYGLLLAPLLLIPYLIRGKPRRIVFSSLLLLREFSAKTAGAPWGRLRLPPVFFLQLLLLLLLALALAEPVVSTRPDYIAAILDNSVSMQAIEAGKSRFESAKEEIRGLLRDFPAGARVDLYVIAPRLERVGAANLTPGKAAEALAGLQPYDLGEPPGDFGETLSRLATDKGYERLFFLTDHPVEGKSEKVRVVSVGAPARNLAVASFEISRPSFTSSQLRARAEVTNFSKQREAVKVLLKGGGKVLSSRAETIPPGNNAEVAFEGFPSHSFYEVEIEASDGLAVDNRRFAVAPSSRALEILAVSPRPDSLASLRSIPGISLKVVSPDAYEKARGEGHSIEIFHYSAPVVLPQKHALFVLPPRENPLVAMEKPLEEPTVSAWREPHSLTQYVNFALFRPSFARVVRPLSFGEAIVQSPEGDLALAFDHRGFRYLVLGFDPFPYLGNDNLPVSIFTLNFFSWFHELSGGARAATGEPLELSPGERGATVVAPNGEKFAVRRGETPFTRTFFQGVYRLVQGDETRLVAVNLGDAKESNLAAPTKITLKPESAATGGRALLLSFWPYLLLFALALLLLEWFFHSPSGRKGRFEYEEAPVIKS